MHLKTKNRTALVAEALAGSMICPRSYRKSVARVSSTQNPESPTLNAAHGGSISRAILTVNSAAHVPGKARPHFLYTPELSIGEAAY